MSNEYISPSQLRKVSGLSRYDIKRNCSNIKKKTKKIKKTKLKIRHGKFTNLKIFSHSKNCLNWNKVHALKSKPKKPYQLKKNGVQKTENGTTETQTKITKSHARKKSERFCLALKVTCDYKQEKLFLHFLTILETFMIIIFLLN